MIGISKPDRLSLAPRTCSASWPGDSTSSNRGSEPNWTARVTNLAFGFERSVLNRLSRRFCHSFDPSKPNWWPPDEIQASRVWSPSDAATYPDKGMHTQGVIPSCSNDVVVEAFAIAGTVKANVSRMKRVANVRKFFS